jgi:hypothetical protein
MTEAFVASTEDAVQDFCAKTGGRYRKLSGIGWWAVEIKRAYQVDAVRSHFGAENIIGFANWGDAE